MKKILIALPALMLAFAGFVSCAEDTTLPTPTQEQKPLSYGIMKSINSTDGFDYYTVCTKNAAGEDMIYTVRRGQEGGRFEGQNRMLFASSLVDNHDSLTAK